MPISSFYGMQTSLRGLMAQQRMLDTTGHNIANASTIGYSRQEATLSASQALQLQVSGSANATGAHLGSGVDVQGFRRIRDQFLDLQYRGQNTSLNEWKAQTEALDTAELALAEPGDNGISAQLSKFWSAWSDLSKSPDSEAAKQALVQKTGALTDTIQAVRSQMATAQATAQGQYGAIAGPGGDVDKVAAELANLNKTISSFLQNGDSPNDLMDRRDVLLDQLSTYGQISVEQLAGGSMNVSFVDAQQRLDLSDRRRQDRGLGRPARAAAGTRVARWAACWPSASPRAARSTATWRRSTRSRRRSPTRSTPPTAAASSRTARPARARRSRSPRRSRPRRPASPPAPARRAPTTSRSRSRSCAATRPSTARTRRSWPRSAAISATRPACRPTPRCSPTRSRTGARASQGVSMDEEMSNLVRFQRAYQASARAMSTMDEMLDVLINRTGRVGL